MLATVKSQAGTVRGAQRPRFILWKDLLKPPTLRKSENTAGGAEREMRQEKHVEEGILKARPRKGMEGGEGKDGRRTGSEQPKDEVS